MKSELEVHSSYFVGICRAGGRSGSCQSLGAPSSSELSRAIARGGQLCMKARFSVNGIQYECEGKAEEFETIIASVIRLTTLTRIQQDPPRSLPQARSKDELMPRIVEIEGMSAEELKLLEKLLDQLTERAR